MSFKIEKLSNKHIKYLFNLRNSVDVRKYSKNNKIIKYQDHKKWFKKSIKSKNNLIYIFLTKNNSKIGCVRFKINSSHAYVSIALSRKFRNKGLSKNILSSAEKMIFKKKFVALVNKKNFKSISLFRSLDYYKYKNIGKFILMKKNRSKNNYKQYLSIINKIEKIRKNNNSNWMDLLRVAFKYSPKETARIMSNIYKHDNKIGLLSKKLSK
jgi:RimJ/RimL family protein N-acetyltransferase